MFILQEFQTSGNDTAVTPAVREENENQAISKFLAAASVAAISSVEIHAVILQDHSGNIIERRVFYHENINPAKFNVVGGVEK